MSDGTLTDVAVEPVDGAALLDGLARLIVRFVVVTSMEADVIALWIIHTWAIDAADATPYLAVNSAEKRSGKSRLLEVLALLVREPLRAVNPTSATIYRLIAVKPCTLLFDEIDAVFGPKSKPNEDLRGIFNAGYRRGTPVPRCVGEGTKQTVEWFDVFGPKVLAGLGGLPDTVADRSLPIRMRRRSRVEQVERLRETRPPEDFGLLSGMARAWAEEHLEALGSARPVLPDELDDRAQDVCEPLIVIADLAGGEWSTRGRQALIAVRDNADAVNEETIGIRLLADIKLVFAMKATSGTGAADRVSTDELLKLLKQDDEAPWCGFRGNALTPRDLAKLLAPYGVKPKQVRFPTGENRKGYERSAFDDAFSRYLPDAPESETSETTAAIDPSAEADVSGVSENRPLWGPDAIPVKDMTSEELAQVWEDMGL